MTLLLTAEAAAYFEKKIPPDAKYWYLVRDSASYFSLTPSISRPLERSKVCGIRHKRSTAEMGRLDVIDRFQFNSVAPTSCERLNRAMYLCF